MKKIYSSPKGQWDHLFDVTHAHGIRSNDIIHVGSQVALSKNGCVLHPKKIFKQTQEIFKNIINVLADLDSSLCDLVRLRCFYVMSDVYSEDEFLNVIAAILPRDSRPSITAIPVPYLSLEDLVVEIEAIAMSRPYGDKLKRSHVVSTGSSPLPEPFVQGIQCGNMIYISGQSPRNSEGIVLKKGDIVAQTKIIMEQHKRILEKLGANFNDVVKINRWYGGEGGIKDFEPAALACASYFSEPGPAATGIPIPSHSWDGMFIKIELVAMLGEDGSPLEKEYAWPKDHWDWHVHLPYNHGIKCKNMIFLGGQVSIDQHGITIEPNNLSAQTRASMENIRRVLNVFNANFSDVVKVLTLYHGKCGLQPLRENFPIRSSYFSEAWPPSTGVPLPELAYSGMMIEIDVDAII